MSKEKKLVPKLRFKDFVKTGEWKQYNLGEITNYVKGFAFKSQNYKDSGVRIIRASDLASDTIKDNGNKIFIDKILADSFRNYKLNKEDIIITTVGSKSEMKDSAVGRAILIKTCNIGLLNQNLVKIDMKEKHNSSFVYSNLLQKRYSNYIASIERGNANQANIAINDLWQYKIIMANFREQEQIGYFFKNIDKMIRLQQLKVNKVKDIKSAYLSEMFPKEGEKYPKKRFEGFTEPWKKYNLGEIGYTISGVGFPNSEQGGKKGIMFLKVSDMNLSENTTEINTSNNFVTAFQVHKRNWKVIEEVPALIFAKVGAALLLDRKRLVNDKFLIDNNMMAYILGEKLVADFTNALFKKIYLPKYAQIGALPSMNDSIVEKIEVLIPSLEEQEKIGKFFKNLDNQIYIEEEKLTKLEKLKQAYLNDMFV